MENKNKKRIKLLKIDKKEKEASKHSRPEWGRHSFTYERCKFRNWNQRHNRFNIK
jgi:hypothetical protein